MTLRLRNTLSGRLEDFQPLHPPRVGMYVCGPTVYNYFHIGNARPIVVFDVVRRHLIASGYEVTFVQNITDIDDKIINRARDEKRDPAELANQYTDAFFEDSGRLGVLPADHNPRATNTIDGIIELIQRLEARGLTYANADGVWFRVQEFDGYGKLSGKTLEALRQGASGRTDTSQTEAKDFSADFALWKAQKTPDEPAWDSPWGKGRPGWHIECSAMSTSLLGEQFDIHAGGEDLTFPHHENEIAQSEGATGRVPFVRYWLHNAFINIAKEETPLTPEQAALVAELEAAIRGNDAGAREAALGKLADANIYVDVLENGTVSFKGSKTLGNIPMVRDIYARGYSGQEIRWLLLRAHYRTQLTFGWKLLDEARAQLARWGTARRRLAQAVADAPAESGADDAFRQAVQAAREGFAAKMDDDFNTPGAIAIVFEFVTSVNHALGADMLPSAPALQTGLDAFERFEFTLGLDFSGAGGELSADEQGWLDARETARQERNWTDSDRLRNRLFSHGIAVEDTPQGQRWHRESPANLLHLLLPGKKGQAVDAWSTALFEKEFRLADDADAHHEKLKAALATLLSEGKAETLEKNGETVVRRKKN